MKFPLQMMKICRIENIVPSQLEMEMDYILLLLNLVMHGPWGGDETVSNFLKFFKFLKFQIHFLDILSIKKWICCFIRLFNWKMIGLLTTRTRSLTNNFCCGAQFISQISKFKNVDVSQHQR